MKIVYICYSSIPSNVASSIHIMKMCNAFASNGHEVILLMPIQKNDKYVNKVSDIYKFYDVKNIFKIQQIPVRTFPLKLLTKRINYNLLALKYINKIKPDLVYGRSVIGCALAALFNYKVIINYIINCHIKEIEYFFIFYLNLKILKKSL